MKTLEWRGFVLLVGLMPTLSMMLLPKAGEDWEKIRQLERGVTGRLED